MQRPRILQAFTEAEYEKAHRLLATRVAYMMGRKFEEGDWAEVYCGAKSIPRVGWSNLNIDVVHGCTGVEHKMLRPPGDKPVRMVYGSRLMHLSATRSIRIEDGDADQVMRLVLRQYADFIEQRREFIRRQCPSGEPEMRTGWVLWQSNLRELLYFEEETTVPSPDDFIAEWHENIGKGARKESKSLWIYEKDTYQKKYSVTTSAGAKIQPYFDVPPASHPNVYSFRVQGYEFEPGYVRVWIPIATVRELERLVGDVSSENLERLILYSGSDLKDSHPVYNVNTEEVRELTLTSDSYVVLEGMFPEAVSDAHRFQLLVTYLTR